MAFGLDSSSFSGASGKLLQYVVMQVTLKEKFFGTGSGNLTELEKVINEQASKGYRLHTISTANGGSKGFGGGDRIQATMVFEKIWLFSFEKLFKISSKQKERHAKFVSFFFICKVWEMFIFLMITFGCYMKIDLCYLNQF